MSEIGHQALIVSDNRKFLGVDPGPSASMLEGRATDQHRIIRAFATNLPTQWSGHNNSDHCAQPGEI